MLCEGKLLQSSNKNRGENVILEIAEAMKNKGFEFPRAHNYK